MVICKEENKNQEISKKLEDLCLEDKAEPQVGEGSSCPPSSSRNKLPQLSGLRARGKEEEMVLKFRVVAEDAYTIYEKVRNSLSAPIIIAMNGDHFMGRNLVAFYVASILRCPLINEHDFDNHGEKSEENQENLLKNIYSLARSQLISGRSVVMNTKLATQKDFDQLKELSEITKTHLALFECPRDFAEDLWNKPNVYGNIPDPVTFILYEFMKKPTSQFISSTNFDMGEIPIILLEHVDFLPFSWSVNSALLNLRAHICPTFESEKCHDHAFKFVNIEDKYKIPCCQCRQLVWGSVYLCLRCRIIFHPTCSYFPEELSVSNHFLEEFDVSNFSFRDKVTLNLRHVAPESDVDASCNCCKQLIRRSTSSRYYSIADEHNLFDLECLFLLPPKLSTKFHEHKLVRSFSKSPSLCNECDTIIDKNSIFYLCRQCSISYDVYCLWLPDTVQYNRDRHPLSLLVLPRVDSDPYFCHGCEKERDTDKWIYYCEDCDFQIHPHCTVKAPCLPRYSSTDISTTNKKYLSTENMMPKELPLHHRSEAEELCMLFKESTKEIKLPIIITTKGHSSGRKLVASSLAAIFSCLLIDEDSLYETIGTSNYPDQVSYREFSQIALSQLQIGLSIVIDCNLWQESEFLILQQFALDTGTPLFIVEFKPCGEDKMQLHRIVNLPSDYEYNVGDTPKIVVDVTAPTFDDIGKLMPHILQSISAYSKEWGEGSTEDTMLQSYHTPRVRLQKEDEVLEGDICNRCSMKISYPILKCEEGDFVLHKACTALPSRIELNGLPFSLANFVHKNDKALCYCCCELVEDYAYVFIMDSKIQLCIDLKCLFTPLKPGINLHEHPLYLGVEYANFICGACGSSSGSPLRYQCSVEDCDFKLSIRCSRLKEKETFDRHCHPFYLIISPEHESNQYVCTVCAEDRDKNHWVYGCIGCEYFIHVRCLVPTGGCPPSVSCITEKSSE